MAAPRWNSSDDKLFQELKDAVAGPGHMADRMRDAAEAAFTWRTVDVELELLALSYDSSLDDAALVRGDTLTAPRTLIFEGEAITVGVEVGNDVLTGQIVPAQPGHVTLMTPQGWFGETESDDAGFFLLARPSPGPIRLECHTVIAHLVTDWVPL